MELDLWTIYNKLWLEYFEINHDQSTTIATLWLYYQAGLGNHDFTKGLVHDTDYIIIPVLWHITGC